MGCVGAESLGPNFEDDLTSLNCGFAARARLPHAQLAGCTKKDDPSSSCNGLVSSAMMGCVRHCAHIAIAVKNKGNRDLPKPLFRKTMAKYYLLLFLVSEFMVCLPQPSTIFMFLLLLAQPTLILVPRSTSLRFALNSLSTLVSLSTVCISVTHLSICILKAALSFLMDGLERKTRVSWTIPALGMSILASQSFIRVALH